MSHSVVAVVIANYVEGLLETMLRLSVNRDVVCVCFVCGIGKMSVGQNVQQT